MAVFMTFDTQLILVYLSVGVYVIQYCSILVNFLSFVLLARMPTALIYMCICIVCMCVCVFSSWLRIM